MKSLLVLAMLTAPLAAPAEDLPPGIVRQLPPGYDVLRAETASFGNHVFTIVALGKAGEGEGIHAQVPAWPRPLLLFQRAGGAFRLAGRNDAVIPRADEGGQCDPFLDGDAAIAVHGRAFTIQSGVACGSHWTDWITFRFDEAAGHYVFDNERFESWSMNRSTAPDAEALVADGPPHILRGDRRHPVAFGDWRRQK